MCSCFEENFRVLLNIYNWPVYSSLHNYIGKKRSLKQPQSHLFGNGCLLLTESGSENNHWVILILEDIKNINESHIVFTFRRNNIIKKSSHKTKIKHESKNKILLQCKKELKINIKKFSY